MGWFRHGSDIRTKRATFQCSEEMSEHLKIHDCPKKVELEAFTFLDSDCIDFTMQESVWRSWCVCVCLCVGKREREIYGHCELMQSCCT